MHWRDAYRLWYRHYFQMASWQADWQQDVIFVVMRRKSVVILLFILMELVSANKYQSLGQLV